MKKVSYFLITFLLVIFSIQSWAATGTTTTHNGFLYKPPLGARGATEKNNFDVGLDRVDARLGKEIWAGDPAIAAALGSPIEYASALTAALTAIGATPCTLHIPRGTYTISSDLTIPATVNLKPEQGAIFAIATGKTLTLNSALDAGLYQIFSCTGTGKVVFGAGAVKEVYPQWWGAVGDGTTDVTAAMKAAVLASQNGVLAVPPGRYRLTGAANLLAGVTGSINLEGKTRALYGPQTIFYIKEATGFIFNKTSATDYTPPNGLYVKGIFFDGTNTGNDTWTGGTTCDGVFKNSGGAIGYNIHFENCTIQGLCKVGAVGLDFTNVIYSTLSNIKVAGITEGWGIKYGGTYSTTNRYDNVNIYGCQEGLLVIQGGMPLVYHGGCIESCTAAVVGSSANIIFTGTHFENIGHVIVPGNITGISDQQIDTSLGAPFNVPVNTWFNFINSNIVFDSCTFFTGEAHSLVAYFRLITSMSYYEFGGSVEFRSCNGNDSYTYTAMPFFIKHYTAGSPEFKIIAHAKGGVSEPSRLFTRADDLRQINFGEFYASSFPGNIWRLVTIKNKRWTFEPFETVEPYPSTCLFYPSTGFIPSAAFTTSQAAAAFQAQGFRVGDEWAETHHELGYPDKWAVVREQRTATTVAVGSSDASITVAATPTATVGDIIHITGASGMFFGTVLSINAGAKTISLADDAGVATTAGFTDANTGLFVQTYKWGAVGQQGYRSGTATPVSAVVPYFIGEMYLDTTAVKWYRSTGLAAANWVALN